MRKTIILMMMLAFTTSALMAGGYQVRLQGQKQTGIGLIGTPFAFGASSIFYNPGSLSFMKNKYSFSGGVSPIFSNVIFRPTGTDMEIRSDNPTGTPFYFYGAGKITDDLSVGLGVYTPFGSSTKWDDNWMGRYLVQEISLQTIFFQPTVSYKFNNMIGIGAGLTVATGSVDLRRRVDAPVNAQFAMDGNTVSYGFNAGVYFQPTEKLSIGVDYRSEISMEIEDGDASFTEVPSYVSQNFPEDGNFSAALPLPANLDAGIAYQVTDKLLLAAEMNLVFWSVYDSLVIDFKENNEQLTDSRNPREYENSLILRLGGEYKINDMITARAGVYYDPAPTSEKYFTPETVSLNTIAFTLGVSIMPVEGLSIDLSYLQLEGMEDERMYEPANFGGTYRARTFIPGIGVSYSF